MNTTLDMDARYTVSGYHGVAFYLTGWATEDVYEGDYLFCDDEECDHQLSEICWAEGDWSVIESDSMVKAVMVGDDQVHVVDIDDLTALDSDAYCGGCGQVGCGWSS